MTAYNKVPGFDIYIGGMFALQRPGLKEIGITHVLSVLRHPLKAELFEPFKHMVVEVDDSEDEDLIQYFPRTNEFVADGLAQGGGVLIHCAMGISRSATVLIAYLMSVLGVPPREALSIVQQCRPIVQPNEGFMKQLEVYYKIGCAKDVTDHPFYQRWLWAMEVEMSNQVGRAPDWIRFADSEGEVARVTGLAEGSGNEVMLELRCRRCRNKLATSRTLTPHLPGESANPDTNFVCAHYFLEPLLWMEPELSKGNISGKLECPKCHCKIGNYAWSGLRCSCGTWVSPGISVARGKVDEVRVNKL